MGWSEDCWQCAAQLLEVPVRACLALTEHTLAQAGHGPAPAETSLALAKTTPVHSLALAKRSPALA